MRPVFPTRGLVLASVAAAALLAGCASNTAEMEAQAEAARVAAEIAARTPPPIALNEEVAQSAAVYLAFSREMATIEGGFSDPEAIQSALRKGAAYDPDQISRGLVAYASILALQSPEFVSGVRQYAVDRTTREKLVADIVADPRTASYIPGADAAAGLITATLRDDIDALQRAATSVENDAYAIQAAYDPRRAWGVAPVPDRDGRLATAKSLSSQTMLPSADEAARLSAAARAGTGLRVSQDRIKPPYPPSVVNALAIAALAALGAAGDDARARTDALQVEPTSQRCLDLSKLMLFQCLAASRPSYEDMFCLGRHIVRDLATCTRGSAMPAPIITVSDVSAAAEPVPTPAPPPIVVTPAPLAPPPVRVTPTAPASPAPARSATERLNTQPTPPGD